MEIRESLEQDLGDVLNVERLAFGEDAEANLVRDLLADESAKPCLSLLAYVDGQAAGHILFTRVRLEPESPIIASILAPLAVIPDFQKQGIGGKLIEEGLQRLRDAGTELVFVLGHPEYYPRHGFAPAGREGLQATFPILDKNAAAWMVQELCPGIIGKISGKVVCADSLNKPEYWQE